MKSSNPFSIPVTISRQRSIQECAAYIYRHRRWPVGVVIALLIIVFIFPGTGQFLKGNYEKFGWLIEVATLVVTCIVVWITDGAQWRESLPKRLSVRFFYDDNVVMECNFAHLSDAGDIRQLGQQIGLQMVDDERLKFRAPLITMKGVQIVENPVTEEHPEFPLVRHYQCNYFLTALPEYLDQTRLTDSLLRWNPPFSDPDYELRE